jgi:hypothetical protein
MKDLTTSNIIRQNILNNEFAISEIQKAVGINGIVFESQVRYLKTQIADFFSVTERTIDYLLEKHESEICKNGYEVLKGNRLIDFKLVIEKQFGNETHFVTKTTILGIFTFRAFLDIAMLLTESERAKLLRSTILDIVIDTINKRTGGNTKYINQRDEDFIHNLLRSEDYRREFTDALKDCVAMGNFKYIAYTNKVYESIFKENASEYRKILNLDIKENVRGTMYSEILDLISSYEYGFAEILKGEAGKLGRALTITETDSLFARFEKQAHWKPLIEKARVKMASRDMCFRDALHLNLEEYISSVPIHDFQRFLGDKSMELDQRLEEYRDALKRLKERD